jgi:hypothetical protein
MMHKILLRKPLENKLLENGKEGGRIILKYTLNKEIHREDMNWIKVSQLNPMTIFGAFVVELRVITRERDLHTAVITSIDYGRISERYHPHTD